MRLNICSCRIFIVCNMNFCLVACLLCFFCSTVCSELDMINKLSDCSDNSVLQFARGLILVSTLDGRMTALHAEAGYTVLWSINTDPGPLLSSNIHKLELTSNGQWIRMIPSLSGGLYKFNGINIESLPVRADHLLRSSTFLMNDGLIISGGRESRIYGIDLDNGEIVYECSMSGCDYNNVSKNIVVIQRSTQTVRAIDMYTGSERWNFSVGYHDVKWPYSVGCHDKTIESLPDFRINAIIPEGIVYASSKTQDNKVLWKHKFDSPVASIWKLQNGKIHPVDLFRENGRVPIWSTTNDEVSPVLYIGMHKKQLYIQETMHVDNSVTKSSKYPSEMENLQIPWDPVPISSTALGFASIPDHEINGDDYATTALSVLYASEYVNGNGFYLFSRKKSSKENKCIAGEEGNETGISRHIDDFADSGATDTPVHVIIVSLWYWWKEVLIISITTAIVVNLVVTQSVLQVVGLSPWKTIQKEIVFIEKTIPVDHNEPGNLELEEDRNDIEYKSRFLLDFETIQCLGKGGFGVVFEARNKIDECNYAVKRIQLPNSLESRERVLREVKALAKLDHHHIVRYFNSWMECPPPKWLETHDSLFCTLDSNIGEMVSSEQVVRSTDNTNCSISERRKFPTRAENLNAPFRQFSTSINDSFGGTNDSFIMFQDSQSNENESTLHTDNENLCDHIEDTVSEKMCNIDSFSQNTSSLYITKDRPGSLCTDVTTRKALQSPRKMYLYIQMQLCLEESLKDWLSQNVSDRDKRETLQMFEQILQAVEYIHLAGLIHRDLKPSNIFFSFSGQIKVGDFGLVTAMANDSERNNHENNLLSVDYERHTAQVGTQLYMSPEQVNGLPYDYKVDIYSLGLILFELLYPFSTQMERCETLQALRRKEFPDRFKQRFTDEFDVLSLMLSHNPKKRPTTFGIRASLPSIKYANSNTPDFNYSQWHFELPSHT